MIGGGLQRVQCAHLVSLYLVHHLGRQPLVVMGARLDLEREVGSFVLGAA